tara:strand:- start:206 stop:1072 length:867 start_codon:yes stop_codon:yes gene_type:complete
MIPTRPFGSTGHNSTVTLFGGAAFMNDSTEEGAAKVLDLLLEHGINHIDTAPRYGDSEIRIGKWMREHRDKFFLATKTRDRGYQAARDSIHRSLERLCVDQLDLLQLHSVGHPTDWEIVFGDEGALEAVVEAREAGLTRFIGITGHGWAVPAMHLRSLNRFAFDSVLMPMNFLMLNDERYADDFHKVLALAKQRGVAVQTIKSVARGPWGTNEKAHNTWYQPLEQQEDIDRAIHWAMSFDDVFINTAGDIEILPRVLEAAHRYAGRPSDEDMRAMVDDQRMTSLFGII